MNKDNIIWTLNRVRVMSRQELGWRVKQHTQKIGERFGIGLAKIQKMKIGRSGLAWPENLPKNIEPAPYITAANRILDGNFDIFAMRDAQLGFPPRWNQDPKTGVLAPAVIGTALNYRNEKLVGNIKYLWEINRHLELVTIAQAYYLTGEDRYSEGIFTLLSSWLDQCPYPLGPNWASSLELAVRIVNWSFIWHLLGKDSSPIFNERKGKVFKIKWLRSIYEHLHFIYRHPSLYSSANNHLIGEYMGLFMGALTWPLWKESLYWCKIAKLGLETETKNQTTADGVNREQAIWYHHEVADMMLLCGLTGKINKIEFSLDYWSRLESMMEFIAILMDVDGNMPMIGDSDDAVMIRFTPGENFNVYRSLLATGAVLFKNCHFKKKAKVFDEKSMWILGEDAKNTFDDMKDAKKNLPYRRTLTQGGYFILGKDFETKNEVKIIVDAGPLGYLSIAAHGHADALSMNLSVGGNEILIDPGTFAYHTYKKWRNYFRGTSAHNTVRVDGEDQSIIGGNFLWLDKASSKCEQWRSDNKEDFFCGFHDGYSRLNDPLIHRRSVQYKKNVSVIVVTDTLVCKGEHLVERFWHFSEHCKVKRCKNSLIAESNGWRVRFETSDNSKMMILRADQKRPLGWISRRFDKKDKTTTAIFINKIKGTTNIKMTMKIEINTDFIQKKNK